MGLLYLKKKDVHDSPCEVSTQQIFINSGQHGDAIHLTLREG